MYLNILLRRILFSTKIVKAECKRSNVFEYFTEAHPIFYKIKQKNITSEEKTDNFYKHP